MKSAEDTFFACKKKQITTDCAALKIVIVNGHI
jgi:hypothetical protein